MMITPTGDMQTPTNENASKMRDFVAIPRRRPMPMKTQNLSYWTPRAIASAMLRGMADDVDAHRLLRRASISAAREDE
jgi:hypothetical protein